MIFPFHFGLIRSHHDLISSAFACWAVCGDVKAAMPLKDETSDAFQDRQTDACL